MATGKRYYWIKLRESFMTSDTVDFLMSQKDGANYVVLYQMLCLKTINTGGRLSRQIGEYLIPYDVEKIQRDCKWFSADTIRVALNLYKGCGLIYEDVDGVLVLAEHDSMVGSETNWAAQKRNQRNELPAPQEGGQCPPDCPPNVPENVHPDIRDKDIRDKSSDTRDQISENRYRQEDEEDRAREESIDLDFPWYRFIRDYEKNIGLMPYGSVVLGELQMFFDEFGPDVLHEVIALTARKHADNPHVYFASICRDWLGRNIKTVDQAKAAILDHERQWKGGKRGGTNWGSADQSPRRVGNETIL